MKVLITNYREDTFEREIDVTIDNFDVYNLNHTLAYIIHPALLRLRDLSTGAPHVDDEDVPEGLRRTSAAPKQFEWETDSNWFLRWEWVLDEMIWSFAQMLDDNSDSQFFSSAGDMQFIKSPDMPYKGIPTVEAWDTIKIDHEGLAKHEARIQNGCRLFGKYYQGLWD